MTQPRYYLRQQDRDWMVLDRLRCHRLMGLFDGKGNRGRQEFAANKAREHCERLNERDKA